MELTQLRYFHQVYRSGSIRRAAGRLNVTQQAVSKQIQNLEQELDAPLFVRTKTGVEPTEYGHMLEEKARALLPELDDLVRSIRDRDKEISGVVALGVQCWQMAQGSNLRYEVLEQFRQDHPRVRITVENLSPGMCYKGVLDRRLDLCVAVEPRQVKDLELTPLRRSEWYILMARDHPLAERRGLEVEDLSGQRLIIAGEEKTSRDQIEQALIGRDKPVFIDVKDYMFDLLGQEVLGRGSLMLTTAAQLRLFDPGRFVMVPIRGTPWRGKIYLGHLSGQSLSAAARALRQHLLTHWADNDN